jgi:hypothetical protein
MRPPVPVHPEDDRLLELAYGEVPAPEARALRQHVDGCARCRGVLDGIAEVRSAFQSVPAEPAPERGLESLLAYGAQAAARARSRRGGLRILGILSAAAALAIAWLILPTSHREAEGVAGAPSMKSMDRVARLEVPKAAPAPGTGTLDERLRDKAGMPVTFEHKVAQKERPKMEEQAAAPGRRAANLADADAKRKDVGKPDAPAESTVALDAPAQLRAEAPVDRPAPHVTATGTGVLGVAGSAPAGATSGGVVAMGGGVAGVKKNAGAQAGADAFHQTQPASPAVAAASPPASARADDLGAQNAAKVAAVPEGEALASAERGRASTTPVSKTAPSVGKGAGNVSEPAARSIQMQSARVGMGTPEQEARLAEIARKLQTARGDERKGLLMERCELEAKLQRGPDAVLSCSQVTQEFPGTPEAARASEIARGFSVQLPAEAPER